MLELPPIWGCDSGVKLIAGLGGSCAVIDGFEFKAEGNMLLLVPAKEENAGNPGTLVDAAGLFVLDGAGAGVGESNTLGLG